MAGDPDADDICRQDVALEPITPEALAELTEFAWIVARRLLPDRHDAEDLRQQVFLALLTRPPTADVGLERWIARVARNLAVQLLRKRTVRREEQCSEDDVSSLCGPAEIALRRLEHGRVRSALERLEEPYRSALVLRYLDEVSPRMIAQRMGVPNETVRTWIKRGLLHMLRELRIERGLGAVDDGGCASRDHIHSSSIREPDPWLRATGEGLGGTSTSA